MAENTGEVKMTPTLGLTGLTMNAMALIAPGAFLWLTFYIQATTGATASGNVARHFRRLAALFGDCGLLTPNWRSCIRGPAVLIFSRSSRS